MSSSSTNQASSSSTLSPPPKPPAQSTITTPASEETTKQQAEARKAVTTTLSAVGSSIDAESRTRLQDLHANSAAIKKQEIEVKRQTGSLEKQNAQWEKALLKSTRQLNEMGDLQNWAEVLERDLLVLEDVVRRVDGGGGDGEEGH